MELQIVSAVSIIRLLIKGFDLSVFLKFAIGRISIMQINELNYLFYIWEYSTGIQ